MYGTAYVWMAELALNVFYPGVDLMAEGNGLLWTDVRLVDIEEIEEEDHPKP